jgi:hypothetical protein
MMQRDLTAKGVREVASPLAKRHVALLARVARKLRLLRLIRLPSRQAAFCQLIGPNGLELFPFSFWHVCVTYSFDCWEPQYPVWETLFRTNRIAHAFLSARQSVDAMRQRVPGVSFEWLPEAIDPGEFCCAKPLKDRGIDVLELGRRFQPYHEAVRDRLRNAGRIHVFDSGKGPLLFPLARRPAMLETYSDTKISICFPRSLTHPNHAGTTETVTARYFEAMASKVLIVGSSPAELCDLFGYDPVVPVDWSDPGRQLCDTILPRCAEYQELVEKNYQRLLQSATFTQRAERIVEVLSSFEVKSLATI